MYSKIHNSSIYHLTLLPESSKGSENMKFPSVLLFRHMKSFNDCCISDDMQAINNGETLLKKI